MFSEALIPADFTSTSWQRHPQLLRGALPWVSERDWPRRFETWCRRPAVARLFVLEDDNGRSRGALLPDVEGAYDLFRGYAEAGDALTLVLNRAESVAPEIVVLRDSFGIGRRWRHDDIVATLSTAGSGIGYHAGHEDGFIVQLAGRRRWRVWHGDVLTLDERAALVWPSWGRGRGANPAKPQQPPLLNVVLEPGDALYLPSLHPHEGVTLEESVSLSIAWRGVAVVALLEAAVGPLSADERRVVEDALPEFLSLVEDRDEMVDLATEVMEQLRPAAARLGFDEDRLKRVRSHVARLVGAARE